MGAIDTGAGVHCPRFGAHLFWLGSSDVRLASTASKGSVPNRFNFHEQPEALVKRLSEINPAMEKAAGGRGSKPPAAILSHYLKRQHLAA